MGTTDFAAALFDMDGLLLDSERAYMAAFLVAQSRLGVPQDPDLFLSCVGVRSAETDLLLRAALPDHVPVSEFRSVWDAGVAARLAGPIPLRPRVLDLLTALTDAGVPLGVATSTRTDVARGRLERSGLGGIFSHLVGGDKVIAAKPDPEIYLKLADVMNVKITACAAFEDSNPGAQAAVASGARTVQVPDLTVPTAAVRCLGHVIAGDVFEGAVRVGLIASDL